MSSIFKKVNLSNTVKESLDAYKGDDYDRINTSLRQNLPLDEIEPDVRKHIENIDSAMRHGEEITVYRGLKNFKNLLDYYKNLEDIGVPRLIELAFCSVSKNIETAKAFVEEKDNCCVVAFRLTSDIKRYDFMDKLYEDEILIERNTQIILESDEYTIVKNLKVYKAIIKPYIPPKITQKDIQTLNNLDLSIDIEKKADELYQELEEESFGSITIDDIDIIVDNYQHWPESTRELVKKKIMELAKI